ANVRSLKANGFARARDEHHVIFLAYRKRPNERVALVQPNAPNAAFARGVLVALDVCTFDLSGLGDSHHRYRIIRLRQRHDRDDIFVQAVNDVANMATFGRQACFWNLIRLDTVSLTRLGENDE